MLGAYSRPSGFTTAAVCSHICAAAAWCNLQHSIVAAHVLWDKCTSNTQANQQTVQCIHDLAAS